MGRLLSVVIPAYNEEASVVVLGALGVTGAVTGLFYGALGVLGIGCVLLCLGVIGYYLGRMYRALQGRPRFIDAREWGDEQ